MRDYDYVVFIGRFQLFHSAHLAIIKKALQVSERVIIIIGSASKPRTPKNPWNIDERKEMILSSLSDEEKKKIDFTHAYDYLYNDQRWATEIQERVNTYVWNKNVKIGIIGHIKDDSSFYLKMFPQWELIEVESQGDMHATEYRDTYFSQGIMNLHSGKIPLSTLKYLNKFFHTKEYMDIKQQHEFIKKYKEQWEKAPYPVVFTTTDAVVIQSGHVLMVKRKAQPGKGLYALPGGFLGYNEKIMDSMMRELKEETKLKIDPFTLRLAIKDYNVFDDPSRSERGRTITHAYLIKLEDGKFPYVKGGDDAAKKPAWIPLNKIDFLRDKIYEDHADIIQYFAGRV